MINFVRIILAYIVPAKPLFSKERRDPTRPIMRFRTDWLQARSEQGEKSPNRLTRSFKTVFLQARSEQREKRSNPSYKEVQYRLGTGKVGVRRGEIQPVLPGVSERKCSRQGRRKERRDPTQPTKSFRTD